jgi:hypothetical protein
MFHILADEFLKSTIICCAATNNFLPVKRTKLPQLSDMALLRVAATPE